MGRAIEDRKDIDKLKMDVKELQAVVAELSHNLLSTKQTKNIDLDKELKMHEESIRKENKTKSDNKVKKKIAKVE